MASPSTIPPTAARLGCSAMTDYAIVDADEAPDVYAGTDVPGEFRRLTDTLQVRAARGDAHRGAAAL